MRAGLLVALGLVLTGCGARTDALPSFALTNQAGQTVSAESLRGRPALVSFMFTNCRDVCPLLTAQLVKIQARARSEGLGPKVRFVSITVDPATDTPDVLRTYATGYGADLATWDFLTGPAADIQRLATEVGVVTGAGDRIGHSNLLLYVDSAGRIAAHTTDLDLDPDQVLPKLRRLIH